MNTKTFSPKPYVLSPWLLVLTALISTAGCQATEDTNQQGDRCLYRATDGATATCLVPTQTPEYYVEQAEKYFDTLDINADPKSVPNYSELVARWEWPPWLLLTGFTKETMISTGELLKKADPSTVPKRDCRFFKTQPFARCRVVFEYEGGPCPIYEEFVFNDAGEMTFIEAWSDLPDMVPTPDEDPWGQRSDIGRLSTRVPGLGKSDGKIEVGGSWLSDSSDKDVSELGKRVQDQWKYWGDELANAPKDFFSIGCGWKSP